MTSNRTSGNLLALQINGEFIPCEMSCDFNFEADLRPASPKNDGMFKEYIQGIRSWSISLNAAMLFRMAGAGLPTVLNAFMMGETINVSFRTKLNDILPNFIISGDTLVQSGNINASAGSLASWNVTLQGNGAFTYEINSNMVFALDASQLGDGSEVLQDGENNIIVGKNG